MSEFRIVATVTCDTLTQADLVARARLGYDEEYSDPDTGLPFDYTLEFTAAAERAPDDDRTWEVTFSRTVHYSGVVQAPTEEIARQIVAFGEVEGEEAFEWEDDFTAAVHEFEG